MSAPTLDRPPGDLEIVPDLGAWMREEAACELQEFPGGPKCDRPARWRMLARCPRCGTDHGGLICSEHRQQMILMMRRANAAGISCPQCRVLVLISWMPL